MTTLDEGPPVGCGDGEQVAALPDVPVTAHRSAPGRTVFVEEGNTDGWIASSLIVDLNR
jgi:hypothetical protein